jgi:hypothetical protein
MSGSSELLYRKRLYHPGGLIVNERTGGAGVIDYAPMIEPTKMPAGPELDAHIAEQVMGLKTAAKIPSYSTDIAAAWTVVETMIRKDGVYFGCPHFKHKHQNLASLGYPEGTECWYCVLNTKQLNKVVLCADTAPLAICRAALLWAVKHGV